MHVHMYTYILKKQEENSLENITWFEIGKRNVQAKEVSFVEQNDSSGASGLSIAIQANS